LLVGVPGLAKTLLVHTVADVLGLNFKRIQFTPDLMPSDILGAELLDENRQFKFIKGPIFSIELLGDATMVTVKIEENLISVKMSNTFNASIGDVVSVLISSSKCQIFDDKTGFNVS